MSGSEKQLADCTKTGEPFNAAGQALRAEAIRDIMLASSANSSQAADPHGIRLLNAVIIGALDLELLSCDVALELRSCSFSAPVNLTGARLPRIILSGSRITTVAESAICADGLNLAGDLILDDHFQAAAAGDAGTVRLRGARIGGRLSLRTGDLSCRSGPALAADYLSVGGDVLLDQGFTAIGAGESGAVRLIGADICGQLSCRHSTLSNAAGPALRADRLAAGGDVVFSGDFSVTADSGQGAVRLAAATVRGQLVFDSGAIGNASGAAVFADAMTADGGLVLEGGFEARGHGTDGAVRLVGAQVGSQLVMRDAALINESGPALLADRLVVGGNLLMDTGFRADGAGPAGCVRLVSARVAGQLLAGPATLANDTGPALAADGLDVTGDFFLRHSFAAAGHGGNGAVRMPGAHVGGQVAAGEARLVNDDGPALLAEAITVDGDLLLQPELHILGTGRGLVRLTGSRIGGRLSVHDAIFEDTGRQAASALLLDEATLGSLWLEPQAWLSTPASIGLEGTTYGGMPAQGSVEAWIRLLRERTPRYAAQPYQQLADSYRAGGREQDARRVLIAQQDDRRGRGLAADGASLGAAIARAIARLGLRVQRVTIGYGYRTWPAFVITVFLAAVTAAVGWAAGHTHLAGHRPVLYRAVSSTSARVVPCSTAEQLVFGIQAPFLVGPGHGACALDTTKVTGEAYDAAFWAVSSLTVASATLAVAGYTGLVRRP
ncbi:MAG TPA: hypothetical protein VFQ44_12030 [Streptosporangiaceae bacterium]|nr:hypothetical protein [Streptosporangiaceae bacterium]